MVPKRLDLISIVPGALNMDHRLALCLLFVVSFSLALMFISFTDGDPLYLYKKIRCRFGMHKVHRKVGKKKTNKYYCKFCKNPRKHPKLKLLDGGRKLGNNKFRF